MDLKLALLFTFVGFLDFTEASSYSAAVEAEAANHMLSIEFYDMSRDDFTTAKEADFKDIITTEANSYCDTEYDLCGLMSNWTTDGSFASADLLIKQYTEMSSMNGLQIEFYVLLPSAIPASQYTRTDFVLNLNSLDTIVTAVRLELNDAIGHGVIAIGDAEYSPPPNGQLNLIIILVACFLTIILVILCCCLQHAEKKRNKASRFPKRGAASRGMSKQRVSPEPTVVVVDEKSPGKQQTSPGSASSNHNNTHADQEAQLTSLNNQHYEYSSSEKYHSPDENDLTTPAPLCMDSSMDDAVNGNTLTPLDRPNIAPLSEDVDEKQRRKEKKERKHRKKHKKSKHEEVEMEYATQYHPGSDSGEPIFHTNETERRQLIAEKKETNLASTTINGARVESAVSTQSTLDRPSTLTTDLSRSESDDDEPDTMAGAMDDDVQELIVPKTPAPPEMPSEAW